ncbi:membrane protein insertion efficiency factor YidD [Thiospirochaeta perfilievii]|uniref:Putative membrane protein insertion efficiency factor n=1 Tax=Thiospirochaeta perfilievii TaxID=252967 RepID=A0A5C1QBK7_9SPIO|nr:membrane protein insertion efficiency factor YidD [Thiospirochaeta perfilievii]QEN04116.1 membrane protein insertion efficiency factor YidD [Thiospirochaeta perfilievii]
MKRFLSAILILPIKLYQILISPLFPPKCIYFPSCSSYCIDSLKKHGPIMGLIYGVLRIFRCSPLFKGGVDPVIEKTTIKEQLFKYKEFIRSYKK